MKRKGVNEVAHSSPPNPHPLIEFRQAVDWNDITALLIVEPEPESWLPTEQALGQAAMKQTDSATANKAQVAPTPPCA
jgi:hypothetical protein